MNTGDSANLDPDVLFELSAKLQEAVGNDHFEAACLQILKQSGILPIAVAHCFAFNPQTGKSTITDESGVVESEGSPISKIIDTFSEELPEFKKAVEQSDQLVNLTSVQKPDEIIRSTIYQRVIRPYGLVDLLHLPLLQANTRFSVIAGSQRIINENDRKLGQLVQRHVVAAMRNHHWLKHAEANGRNIEAVSGRSLILTVSGRDSAAISDWDQAIDTFNSYLGPNYSLPSEPMPQLLEWVQSHCDSYPLQATDLNRAEFQIDNDTSHTLHAVFLGDRNRAHRLLLYIPIGVPDTFGLSKREKDVLHWICQGKSNEMIAGILNISKFTVRNHITHILSKLHVESRSEAVSIARGWFED